MMNQRKGFIMIETNLLFQSFDFEVAYRKKTYSKYVYLITNPVNFQTARQIKIWLGENLNNKSLFPELDKDKNKFSLMIDGQNFEIRREKEEKGNEKELKKYAFKAFTQNPAVAILDQFGFKVLSTTDNAFEIDAAVFDHDLILIFPDYVDSFTDLHFETRLELLLESTVPVQVSHKFLKASVSELSDLIPKFCDWRNALGITKSKGEIEAEIITLVEMEVALLVHIGVLEAEKKQMSDDDPKKNQLQEEIKLMKAEAEKIGTKIGMAEKTLTYNLQALAIELQTNLSSIIQNQ